MNNLLNWNRTTQKKDKFKIKNSSFIETKYILVQVRDLKKQRK